MKRLFSQRRRRFAGIALDMYFDHLLIGWMNEFRAKTRKKFLAPDEVADWLRREGFQVCWSASC